MKLVAKNICVDRGWRRIVEGLDFSLQGGNALIVTGENGSGKSTLLRAIAGLLPVAHGKLTLDTGTETLASAGDIGGQMHYLGALNAMKPALSVQENLAFWQGFLSGKPGLDIADALTAVDLAHTSDLPFGYLSTGMKRRIAIARLLVIKRPIWVVDEPTSGLDEKASKLFVRLAADHCKAGGMLIAATHLPLPVKGATSLHLERLYTFHEGDEAFDLPASGANP